MTDFVVFSFVLLVAVILLCVAIGSVVWVFISPDADISDVLKSLADIVSAIISALIGFMAGRGQGREETHEQYRDRDDAEAGGGGGGLDRRGDRDGGVGSSG